MARAGRGLRSPSLRCEAWRGSETGVSIRIIKSGAPRPLANYSEALVAGDLVFAAGQLASDFKTGVPAEARRHGSFPYYGSDIELQTEYVLGNLARTFAAAGSSLDHVVKAQVFLTDLDLFHGFDAVWKRYFKTPPPRTTIGCTGLLVKDTLVEIDLVGYLPRAGLAHRPDASGADDDRLHGAARPGHPGRDRSDRVA